MDNQEQKEKIFPTGLYFEIPENAPDFVKGKLSIDVQELTEFMEEHQTVGGRVFIDLKLSKTGKPYAELNTWKPTKKETPEKPIEPKEEEPAIEYPEEEAGDIPF